MLNHAVRSNLTYAIQALGVLLVPLEVLISMVCDEINF